MIDFAGRDRRTVNYLKTVYFARPEWTPARVYFLPSAWMKHRERLEELVLSHPRLFPGFRKGSVDYDFKSGVWGNPLYELGRHTDCWGTVWNNIARGFDSQVDVEPLADWSAFDAWKKRAPDPEADDSFGPRNWAAVAKSMADAKARGGLASCGPLMHGFFFMRLYYLRGFENLLLDIADDDPRLRELIAVVENYSAAVVRRALDLGAEEIGFAEDLGMQTSLPISPAAWRKFVKPTYEATIGQCRKRGILAGLHSDGHILEIIGDLIETGVTLLNPQFRANGLAGLRQYARGKVALSQDLDRQLFPFATPREIEDHVGEVFEGLYLRKGGLILQAEFGPDVPLDNAEALCRTMEKLCRLPEPAEA